MTAENPNIAIDQELVIQWPWPFWSILIALLAIGIFVFSIYRSERGNSRQSLRGVLMVLRASILILVLWMLMGWSWQRAKVELPDLVIAVDVSESMMTTEETSNPRDETQYDRLQRVKQLLKLSDRTWKTLHDNFQLTGYLIAEDAQRVNSPSEEFPKQLPNIEEQLSKSDSSSFRQHSRLGDSIIHILDAQAGRSTAALIVFSDGICTAGQSLSEAAIRARNSAIPIHSICLGSHLTRPDLRVGDILVEPHVFLGDQVSIETTVLAEDVKDVAVTKLSLVEVGTNRVLDEQTFEIQPFDTQASVNLKFEPTKPGPVSLQLAIQSLPQEADVANNKSQITVHVQDRVIRALMVFQQPSYEFRYLKHFLERSKQEGTDQNVSFELTSILQSGDTSYVQQDGTARRFVSSDPSEISKYDVFIFGPFDANMVTQSSQQAIVRAVIHAGSGSVFLASAPDSIQQLTRYPLGVLLPVESVSQMQNSSLGYELESTNIGRSVLPTPMKIEKSFRPGNIGSRIPIQSLFSIDAVKSGAQVLANAVRLGDGLQSPLVVSQFAGAGRTCLLATDETYRWTTAYGTDQEHQRFWGQLLRWLSRGKLNFLDEARLSVEPKQAQLGMPLKFELQLATGQNLPEEAEIRLEAADAKNRTVQLQRQAIRGSTYRAIVDELSPGDYRAIVIQPALPAPPTARFSIAAPPAELANLRADQKSMEQLANSSRGRFYLETNGQEWHEHLPVGKSVHLGNLPPQPLWNSHWIAGIFVTLLTGEWLLRRRARML